MQQHKAHEIYAYIIIEPKEFWGVDDRERRSQVYKGWTLHKWQSRSNKHVQQCSHPGDEQHCGHHCRHVILTQTGPNITSSVTNQINQ